jgi:hypothetical protein
MRRSDEGEHLQARIDDHPVLRRAAHHRRPHGSARARRRRARRDLRTRRRQAWEARHFGCLGSNTGDKMRLLSGHCDPTGNLYDWYLCIRKGRVEQLWPITRTKTSQPKRITKSGCNSRLPSTSCRRTLIEGRVCRPTPAARQHDRSRRAADPRGYCAAAAVLVSRKAGITSFARRSRSASCTSSGVPSGVAQMTRSRPG